MPRNKVLEKAKVNVGSSRNAYDLSQEASITSLCGEIDVPYWHPVLKGTKGSVSRKCFTRTADVVSPAFHRVTEHFDFFLVPLHALWRQWENWKLNINDMQDTNLVRWLDVQNNPNLALPTNCPRMNFSKVIPQIFKGETQSAIVTQRMNNVLRMADWFGYKPEWLTNESQSGADSIIMNLFPPAAYQKVYFEHYRNTVYESNNPYAFNFDWLYDGSNDGLLNPHSDANPKHRAVCEEIFKVRHVNMRNDYFHNIYPSLNYVASLPSGANFSVPSNIGQLLAITPGTVQTPNGPEFNISAGSVITGQSTGAGTGTHMRGVTVQSIRAAFALDKLMRASAYAPKHVKEQYKAQFGVDGQVYDSDMRSQRIGSFQSDVQFMEVTNMAQSDDYNLGDLGAKGLGGDDGQKPIEFYAEYDSILICMHYFLPRSRYDAAGIFEWNTHIAREDFYVKAFENLGLRPFYVRNFNGLLATTFAWTVPNFELKIKPDLNHGEFKEKFISYDYDPEAESGSRITLDEDLQDQLSTFVPHTLNNYNTTVQGFNYYYFKVWPESLDNIFKNQVPSHHPIGFYQFFTNYRISVPVVAPMNVHGQPSL